MRQQRFNEYAARPAQSRSVRREAIATWLRERLSHGPAWPTEITRQGKSRGYLVGEICSALGAIRGQRDRAGRCTLDSGLQRNRT